MVMLEAGIVDLGDVVYLARNWLVIYVDSARGWNQKGVIMRERMCVVSDATDHGIGNEAAIRRRISKPRTNVDIAIRDRQLAFCAILFSLGSNFVHCQAARNATRNRVEARIGNAALITCGRITLQNVERRSQQRIEWIEAGRAYEGQ